MGVDTSQWSHLVDFVGHSIGRCRVSFDCRVYVYLHYDRNIRTIIMLTVGLINVLCLSPNYAITHANVERWRHYRINDISCLKFSFCLTAVLNTIGCIFVMMNV